MVQRWGPEGRGPQDMKERGNERGRKRETSAAKSAPCPRRSAIQATRWAAGVGLGFQRTRGEVQALPQPPVGSGGWMVGWGR
eukprot:6272322-Pyramimonas_sp.AAC.1